MRATTIRAALRYFAGWGTAILFVVLLTLIFSFLGAFFCAALAGMMVGSVKLPRWQTIAVSLVSPAVLCSILRAGGAELLTRQLVLLSVLCLAIFWLTYLIIHAVVRYERKAQPVGAVRAGERRVERQDSGAQRGAAAAAPAAPPCGELSLELLQGKWSWAGANGNSQQGQKLMEIEDERLLLTINDSAGKVSFLGKGEVRLSDPQPRGHLTISGTIFEAPDDTVVSI